MNLGARTAAWSVNIPYDSQVEYIESTGTQYVDMLNLNPEIRPLLFTLDIEYEYTAINGESPIASFWYGGGLHIGVRNSNLGFYLTSWFVSDVTANIETRYHLVLDIKQLYNVCQTYTLNGTSTQVSTVGLAYSNNTTLKLFSRGDATDKCSARIYSFKMKDVDGNVLIDAIPVRVGDVGYLYDRARPTIGATGNGLLGNSGTGTFTLGPDI